MELETKNKFKLGIFILLGLVILVGVLFYMGSTRQLLGNRIAIYAVFKNVEGLKEGNNVWFSGIKVGVVKSVQLASDSTVRAQMVIDEDASVFIKKDSHVTIQSQGLMGNKIISIAAGSPNVPSAEEGDELPTVEPTGIEDIMGTIKETAGETADLAANLAAISEKIQKGEGVVGKLIFDTVTTQRIEVSLRMLEESGRNVKEFSEQINSIAYKINNGDGLTARAINDNQWADKVNASLDSLHQASAMMTAAGRELKTFAEKLNEEKGTIQQLLSDSAMANDMHQALINIKEGTENMDEVMNTINRSWILNLFNKNK